MSKSFAMMIATALTLGVTNAAPAAALGPEAAACRAGAAQPSVLVHVDGFKTRTGSVRVQVYGSNPDDFLAKGRKLKRIDLPVTKAGPMDVCVRLPNPGDYAIAVRHDVDGTGKSGWSDGGGFSRNPRLSLFALKPKYRDVVIAVGPGTKPVPVVLNYRDGLTIRPVAMSAL
ncbi:MAG: DUF2141 domain-containing protein [Sphingomonas sp.]